MRLGTGKGAWARGNPSAEDAKDWDPEPGVFGFPPFARGEKTRPQDGTETGGIHMRPSTKPRPRLLAAAVAAVLLALLAAAGTPKTAEARHTRHSPRPIPVRITLDDAFGPNQVVVPPLSLQGNPLTTETKTLRLRGYIDGDSVIDLFGGKVTINFTAANLSIDPIVLDASSCPVIRTSPITVRLDTSKPSSATADIFKGTVSLKLNALIRVSLVSDGSPCGLPVVTGPYVESAISQSATGGTFKLLLGFRDGKVMIGVVKGETTAPNTVFQACIAEGSPDTACPAEGILALDPVTLTVRMAGWVGLR